MKALILCLKKIGNDFSFKQYFLMVALVFVVLLAMTYVIFLMPKHMAYNKQEEIKQNLLSQKNSIFVRIKSGEYEKIPKQNLFPENIQNLQSDLVSLLTKSEFDQYEIKLEGAEVVSKQCCFKFSLNAKTRFKRILKLFRNLRKD